MKYTGIILGGGKGLELYPLTPMINKALLPIGNKKMIMYQLELLDKPCITSTF
jgi:NDP-sugar pyrophosphorylase family protein